MHEKIVFPVRIVLVLVLLLLLGLWSVSWVADVDLRRVSDSGTLSDDLSELRAPVQQPDSQWRSPEAGAPNPVARSATGEDHIASSLPPDERAVSPTVRYGRRLGGRFDTEPIDPDWAPQMAATIDNVLRSMGGYVRDVKVDCFTAACRAVVLYHRSFFLLDESTRDTETVSLMERTSAALDQLIEASPRLAEVTGLGLARVSTEWPDESTLEDDVGTILFITGAE